MNQINVISPYRYLDMWVFDDPKVGLLAEPFVGGADTMIDSVTAELADPQHGFTMIFSANAFPNYGFCLEWRRKEGSGNIYYSQSLDAEGWLCPALLRYFVEPPQELFVSVKITTGFEYCTRGHALGRSNLAGYGIALRVVASWCSPPL